MKKSVNIIIRATPQEKYFLEEVANKLGISYSQVLRDSIDAMSKMYGIKTPDDAGEKDILDSVDETDTQEYTTAKFLLLMYGKQRKRKISRVNGAKHYLRIAEKRLKETEDKYNSAKLRIVTLPEPLRSELNNF